jgi:DHA3 family macrolide efflux protein-like MFS transporter
MQGRVFTLINSLCTAMMPISMVVAAPVAEAVGVRGWYWLGGIITVLAGAVGWMMPKIRAMEDWQMPEVEPITPEGCAPISAIEVTP